MYEVTVLRTALKDIRQIPSDYTRLIGQHIDELAADPRPVGAKKLRGSQDYSLRVGVYRILYEIDDDLQQVKVFRIRHRREAYR